MLEKKKRKVKSKGAVNDLANLFDRANQLLNAIIPIMDRLQDPPYNVPPPSEPVPLQLSPWDIFGLRQNCSEEEFKRRYRELMKMYHPDKGAPDVMMKRVNQAAEMIKAEKGWK